MKRAKLIGVVALGAVLGCGLFSVSRVSKVAAAEGGSLLHATRESRTDLEVSWPASSGSAAVHGFVTYKDLLGLPQVTATKDENVTVLWHTTGVKVTGVAVEDLERRLKVPAGEDLLMARCTDGYVGMLPAAYVAAHRPILVLAIDGVPLGEWARKAGKMDLGPYMISYADFVPTGQVLAHKENAQIPFGVVELEFKRSQAVFGPITPAAKFGEGSPERAGFAIAKQNCMRCHNAGPYGGIKAGWSWETLTLVAKTDGATFTKYVHDPVSVNAKAQMPGNPKYDDETVAALRAYFASLAKE
ncbi:hypothetical protein [Granulicella sp. dw_53]|uniref:hypothetical protein n=1 Tax=Granulicella sp. dw_53 TaxID=2719792 RepID=UPI001BD60DE8|nr:hypothetical protein [Granulicella sp. dw_53]